MLCSDLEHLTKWQPCGMYLKPLYVSFTQISRKFLKSREAMRKLIRKRLREVVSSVQSQAQVCRAPLGCPRTAKSSLLLRKTYDLGLALISWRNDVETYQTGQIRCREECRAHEAGLHLKPPSQYIKPVSSSPLLNWRSLNCRVSSALTPKLPGVNDKNLYRFWS